MIPFPLADPTLPFNPLLPLRGNVAFPIGGDCPELLPDPSPFLCLFFDEKIAILFRVLQIDE